VTGLPAPAEAAWTALAFILGAAIGSFLATILIRWPQGRSVVAGRSACDKCGRILEARDLVPILSWSLARGRCRTCGARIDRRHLAAEAGAAIVGDHGDPRPSAAAGRGHRDPRLVAVPAGGDGRRA
jgi:leader peptidase (prepilin peptidase)/N-methyltransferase